MRLLALSFVIEIAGNCYWATYYGEVLYIDRNKRSVAYFLGVIHVQVFEGLRFAASALLIVLWYV
jgi:hypothetical protein